MDGGFVIAAVLAAAALLAVGLFIRYLLGLIAALKMRADGRQDRLVKVKAVILWTTRAHIGSSRAAAEYALGERKIRGRMICASSKRLSDGLETKVLISERAPKFFIVEKKQLDNAAFTYWLMCFVFLIIAALLIFFAVWRIV